MRQGNIFRELLAGTVSDCWEGCRSVTRGAHLEVLVETVTGYLGQESLPQAERGSSYAPSKAHICAELFSPSCPPHPTAFLSPPRLHIQLLRRLHTLVAAVGSALKVIPRVAWGPSLSPAFLHCHAGVTRSSLRTRAFCFCAWHAVGTMQPPGPGLPCPHTLSSDSSLPSPCAYCVLLLLLLLFGGHTQ